MLVQRQATQSRHPEAMSTYRVRVRGSRVPLSWEGVSAFYGFHALRYVGAATEAEARARALELVAKDLADAVGAAPEVDLAVEEANELGPADAPSPPGEGFTFFPEELER
jgi:hypothetical protein